MRAELNRNLTEIVQKTVGLAKQSAVLRPTLVALAVSAVWLCAAHPASAQLRGGDFRPAMSVGPRAPSTFGSSAFGNAGRVDRTFRNGPSDDGVVVSSEPTVKRATTKNNSNAKRIDTSGVPPADERRYVTDEVVIRL